MAHRDSLYLEPLLCATSLSLTVMMTVDMFQRASLWHPLVCHHLPLTPCSLEKDGRLASGDTTLCLGTHQKKPRLKLSRQRSQGVREPHESTGDQSLSHKASLHKKKCAALLPLASRPMLSSARAPRQSAAPPRGHEIQTKTDSTHASEPFSRPPLQGGGRGPKQMRPAHRPFVPPNVTHAAL